jgi:hypothetical protein
MPVLSRATPAQGLGYAAIIGAGITAAAAVGTAAIGMETAKKQMSLQKKLAGMRIQHEQLLQEKRHEFEKEMAKVENDVAIRGDESGVKVLEGKLQVMSKSPVLYLAAGLLVFAILKGAR